MNLVFDFSDFGTLVLLVSTSLLVAGLLGVLGGLVSTLVIQRDASFAVHGISELSFAGASIALLSNIDVTFGAIAGSMLAALIIGLVANKPKLRNSLTGVIMPFGLGIGILALSLYQGRAASKFGLLTGSIVSIGDTKAAPLFILSGVILIILVFSWRRLLFASIDPAVAAARGVNLRVQSILFMAILGMAVAISVQIVGALLVLTLLVTPAAAAARVTNSQLWGPLLSVIFGVTSAVGGMLLSLGAALPVSPFITTVSFTIYIICLLISVIRKKVRA
ncbi:MAG: metal ABC transporter permease [Micrococcales bacterium]|nr:metal ABC transporter permease [Micrococcales bacterium]NBR55261.1 metal ABC transporter permease [Micrococcales bacterium]NBR62063.1 metal ABC transporter permease [Actinomycetota bacterium]NBT48632.1 metal ABC transporter permease [Actinomycetota bacterium]NBY43383.1 metal ABC transporter permease [Micrococcales bacterium]